MEDCEHELVFQELVNDCWFAHICKHCNKIVLSNRFLCFKEEEEETEGDV